MLKCIRVNKLQVIFAMGFASLLFYVSSLLLFGNNILVEVRVEGVNISIPQGMQASLDCVVYDPQLNLQVAIIKDDKIIISTNDHINHSSTKSLTYDSHDMMSLIKKLDNEVTLHFNIKKLHKNDTGCYFCKDITTNASPHGIGCIDVLEPPENDIISKDISVKEGESISFICKFRGNPHPSVTWEKEQRGIIPGDQVQLSPDGSVLHLSQVNRRQSGEYYCTASNGVPPSVTRKIYLEVHYSPELFINSKQVEAVIGRDIRIECKCMASPLPHVYWLFNDKYITHSHKHNINNDIWSGSDVISSSLRLRPVGPRDYGAYYCLCNNTMGTQQESIHLIRKARINKISEPSLSHLHRHNKEALTGNEVKQNKAYDNELHTLKTVNSQILSNKTASSSRNLNATINLFYLTFLVLLFK